jgi:cytochrome oxidase assembly protein ShyY1
LKIKSKLSSKKITEPWSFLKTFFAFLLVSLCLIAANWQYDRGVTRHAKNFDIKANTALAPIALENLFHNYNFEEYEWRTVKLSGTFMKENEVLLRNRYNSEGKYGYQYLTLFESQGKKFWIDRGWVKAGANALERPELPATPSGEIALIGRIRLDSSLPRGSFFALPAAGNLISSWNLRSKVETENFYIDLISGEAVTPDSPAELPELSDGPHMAYALQWIFFASLIIYARILIRRR